MSVRHVRNPFVPAGPGDSRSPCPALNALANHNYIPHSGRSIPFFQLVQALKLVYNCSYPLALLLSFVGFLWCGHLTGSWFSTRLTLDLHDLALHNHIEHDGSLAHADAAPDDKYAPILPDPLRLATLLGGGSLNEKGTHDSKALTFFDFARVRYLRDAELLRPLDTVHALITRGEVALTLLALSVSSGDGPEEYTVPHDHMKQWFAEDRLPDKWEGPRSQVGLMNTHRLGQKVQVDVQRLALTHSAKSHSQ